MTLRLSGARSCLALAALLLAGGCGMYGDLYLEEPAPPPPEVEEGPPIAEGAAPAAEEPGPEEEDRPGKPQPPPDGGWPAGRP